jgi:hypothetical protein
MWRVSQRYLLLLTLLAACLCCVNLVLTVWRSDSVRGAFGHESFLSSPADAISFTAIQPQPFDDLLVQQGDRIYLRGDWDGAPIVLEEYKLIFFTTAKVGCTVWKQLFRRMMKISDWNVHNTARLIPWNPELNGLKYLYDYNRTVASYMMIANDWTRAIFVRDPKERFLSAYLDKVVDNKDFFRKQCCLFTGACVAPARESLQGFFDAVQTCEDAHWKPQHRRMESKYWRYVNFVGHMETTSQDAEHLLKMIGAWKLYGQSGWGRSGNLSIFKTSAGGAGREHATNAKERFAAFYTPSLERQVELYYSGDYANSVMNLTTKRFLI